MSSHALSIATILICKNTIFFSINAIFFRILTYRVWGMGLECCFPAAAGCVSVLQLLQLEMTSPGVGIGEIEL